MYETDCVVVGAGVVGLAVARALALAGREVVILEREGLIGSHTSSRNSEVIHAGIYYPRGSAKARLCVAGRDRLYAYAEAHGVPHRRLGKIIVAAEPAQAAALEGIAAAAAANGAGELEPLSRPDLARLEPALRGEAGLLSPMTGIVDSHALMLAYLGEAEDHGASLALHARLVAAEARADGIEVVAESGGETVRLRAPGAGQRRRALRRRGGGGDRRAAARARARDLLLQGQLLQRLGAGALPHLIYPVPERDGLGVHLTLDMAGQGALRPGHRVVEGIDYRLDARRCAASTPRSAATGPASPTPRSPRATPASGRSSSPRAAPPPTSPSRARRCTACPGS